MKLIYNTRNASGADITKEVITKQHDLIKVEFDCKVCGGSFGEGVPIKKIVSANFTEWQYVGEYVCGKCSELFSLCFYSYIIDGGGLRLFNVREMAVEIQNPQTPPFKIVVTKSQKKHLFYKSEFSFNPVNFSVNLEGENIPCNLTKLTELFTFVSNMQTLGESKRRLEIGEIRTDILKLTGYNSLKYLKDALKTRMIQIPLVLSQKSEVKQKEALCNINLIVNR